MPELPKPSDPWAFVFNTPLECGLRSVAILLAAYPKGCDIQRLVQYDYLVVHSGDVEDGPPSIHPATPHRAGELLVRRPLIEQGLDFMARRKVVEKQFNPEGITYMAGEYASVFLEALTAEYVIRLKKTSAWVIERFAGKTDDELGEYMRGKWSQWGAEFVWNSLFDTAE